MATEKIPNWLAKYLESDEREKAEEELKKLAANLNGVKELIDKINDTRRPYPKG